ncbi:MAG: FkbM family methyltransferase [Chloroflexi bacterium]|nr:FkbM family methyltransferase [Chloroflexota bacterium]
MSLMHRLNHLINQGLRRVGYKIIRTPEPLSLEAAFARAVKWNPQVGTVIDVGASNGSWSRIAQRYYPNAGYLLIEANPVHQAELAKYRASTSSSDYVLAAAGKTDGTVFFDARTTFGGVAASEDRPGYEAVSSVKIDTLVTERNLPSPFFIKLDTHGYEIPILEGASETLKQTSLLLIETYNFTIQPESLRFYEMCSYLLSQGSRSADVIEPLHRPSDGAFWQFDLLFIRSDHAIWQSNIYE